MLKSTPKVLGLALLIVLIGSGAAIFPRPQAAAVSVPVPTSPINNALSVDNTPTLKWNASTPPASLDHYEYQLASDSGFTAMVANGNVAAGTEQVTVGPLTRARTYFWRVRACDNVGPACTGWSTTESFRVSVAAPVQNEPANNSYLITNRDPFQWNSVLNATGYTLQVMKADGTLVINTTTAATVTWFTPTSDLPVSTELFWHVRANNSPYGPGPWSPTWKFTTANPPTVPTLEQPHDGNMTTDHSPGFRWSVSTVPSGTEFSYYHVQIAEDTNFTSLVVDDTATHTRTDPTYQVPNGSPLDGGKTYYWRVRACNEDGMTPTPYCSAWPDYFTLHISLDAPTPLLNPADGSLLTSNRPIFQWTSVPQAVTYTVQLSRNPSFTTTAFQWIAHRNWYQPVSPLPPSIKYYWRVQANHPIYGPALWSEVFSLTTGNPPTQPISTAPSNGALVTSAKPTLSWRASTTPENTTFAHYQVQVDDDPAFGSPAVDVNILDQATPRLQPADYPAPLARVVKYYWHVRACNVDAALNAACSEWSPTWNFRVAAAAPTGLTSAYPLLDWNDVSGATKYYVEILRNGVVYKKFTTSVSQISNVGFLSPGTYKWRVRVLATANPGFAPSLWSVIATLVVP